MKRFNFPYEWYLKDGYSEKNGYKVFSCFACGGGSTMGYKLAGFEVLGFNEIDPKMAKCYIKNHNPKYQFIESIQDFKNRNDLPKELFNLDILDGSPPCSSFSMAGNRDKDWGKNKKFREGQQKQVLDTLFFDFIDLAKKLKPKVVISENVPGILMGDAIKYVSKIYSEFKKAGYYTFHRILDASKMGVPQKRKRVFFFSVRKDLMKYLKTIDMFGEIPKIDLMFNEKEIVFEEIIDSENGEKITKMRYLLWEKRSKFDKDLAGPSEREFSKRAWFGHKLQHKKDILFSIISGTEIIHFDKPCLLNEQELIYGGTFPKDYNFLKQKAQYLIGMSVPPVMTAQISKQIQIQWLDKFKKK